MANIIYMQAVPAGRPATGLRWSSKSPADVLHYVLDCEAWLTATDVALVAADVSATPGLRLFDVGYEQTGNASTAVVVRLGGGVPQTTEIVRFLLRLTGDDLLEVLVDLPIRAAAPPVLLGVPLPDGPIGIGTPLTVNGETVTVNGQPVLV